MPREKQALPSLFKSQLFHTAGYLQKNVYLLFQEIWWLFRNCLPQKMQNPFDRVSEIQRNLVLTLLNFLKRHPLTAFLAAEVLYHNLSWNNRCWWFCYGQSISHWKHFCLRFYQNTIKSCQSIILLFNSIEGWGSFKLSNRMF